jgi:hypothetical protein
MMLVRNKIEELTCLADLRLQRGAGGHSQFVLLLHRPNGAATLGIIAAAIACELIEYTPQELVALRLAGFRLPVAGAKQPNLPRLTGLLTHSNKRKARSRGASARANARSHAPQTVTSGQSAQSRTHPRYRDKHPGGFAPAHHLQKKTRTRAERPALHRVGH